MGRSPSAAKRNLDEEVTVRGKRARQRTNPEQICGTFVQTDQATSAIFGDTIFVSRKGVSRVPGWRMTHGEYTTAGPATSKPFGSFPRFWEHHRLSGCYFFSAAIIAKSNCGFFAALRMTSLRGLWVCHQQCVPLTDSRRWVRRWRWFRGEFETGRGQREDLIAASPRTLFFGERWVGCSPGLRRGATVFCPLRGLGESADSEGDVSSGFVGSNRRRVPP